MEDEDVLIANIITHSTPNPGRNDLCPCGSGKKYKKCHGPLDESGEPCDNSFWDNPEEEAV